MFGWAPLGCRHGNKHWFRKSRFRSLVTWTWAETDYRSAGPWLAEAPANWPICKKALMKIYIVMLLEVKIWWIVKSRDSGSFKTTFFLSSFHQNKIKSWLTRRYLKKKKKYKHTFPIWQLCWLESPKLQAWSYWHLLLVFVLRWSNYPFWAPKERKECFGFFFYMGQQTAQFALWLCREVIQQQTISAF